MKTCRCIAWWVPCLFMSWAGVVGGAELVVEPTVNPKPEIVAALAALGDNSSCVLTNTTIIEELGDFAKGWHSMKKNGPGGRDFTIKMAWMPDRRRAFFCGANHGSPHRFNDAWEYDLPGNTWILLYVPDYNDRGPITDYDRKVLVLQDGWLRTRKGGPAHPAHTWWGLTYDPGLKAVLWYCAWPSYRLKEKLDAIGATREQIYKGPPLWAFYPYDRKWEPVPTAQPWPRNSFGASLEYIPELGGALWQYGSTSWLLDGAQKTWKEFKGKDGLPIETLVCYDSHRKLLIAHRGPVKTKPECRTWHMALDSGKPGSWEKVVEAPDLPNGHDARAFLYYDPVGKVALLYERGEKALWAYDPDKKAWTALSPDGAAPPFGDRERVVAYMDPARNVFVAIGYGKTWCYRFKKRGAANAGPLDRNPEE